MDPEDVAKFTKILSEMDEDDLYLILSIITAELNAREDVTACILAITLAAKATGDLEDLHDTIHEFENQHDIFAKFIRHVSGELRKLGHLDLGDIHLN